jgi:predicted CXXCH cytochrome family protein
LCSSCHELEEKEWADTDAVTGENEHTRSLTPDCGRCHVPHVSRFPNLLRSDEGSLCGSCHEAQAVDEAVHAASGGVECSSCHDPHFLSRPDGLLAGLPNLCHECHEQGGAKEGQVHPPIVRNPFCKRCHDPHGSTPGLLRAASSGLCTPCHSKVLEEGHGEELEECGSCLPLQSPRGGSRRGTRGVRLVPRSPRSSGDRPHGR